MNRSQSKIRHILESNLRLEKRVLKEEDEMEDNSKFDEIIAMDSELDNDPKYKEYEKKYMRQKVMSMISSQMGLDADAMEEEELDAMIDMMMMFADLSKDGDKKLTPENIMSMKDGVISTVSAIMEMANEDEEYELSEKLKNFVDKLNEL
jgi:hypothetical protein